MLCRFCARPIRQCVCPKRKLEGVYPSIQEGCVGRTEAPQCRHERSTQGAYILQVRTGTYRWYTSYPSYICHVSPHPLGLASTMASMASHLADLLALATPPHGAGGAACGAVTAKDVTVSLENALKNALDDQAAGHASLLFERRKGLPALLVTSVESAGRDASASRELRSELLRLIDWIILELCARGKHTHIAQYVTSIAHACMLTFAKESSSAVRAACLDTLLSALDLRDHVPNLSELRSLLFPPREQTTHPSAVQLFWRHFTSPRSKSGTSETVRGRKSSSVSC